MFHKHLKTGYITKMRFLRKVKKQIIATITFVIFVCTYFIINSYYVDVSNVKSFKVNDDFLENYEGHDTAIEKFLEKREKWETSNLGTILFKKTATRSSFMDYRQDKTFVVLVWKYYKWLTHRHIQGFNHSRTDPLDSCIVKNCIFTGNDTLMNKADAVLIHLQHGLVPEVEKRNPNQRWIFLSDESPKHTFMSKKKPKLADLVNLFNWSMTYRTDSDIPVPYGRTVPLPLRIPPEVFLTDIVPNWWNKKRDVIATILISNCHVSYRMNYLNELKKYIKLDVYGGCSENFRDACPGHFKADCNATANYLFYLVFENSNCDQYLSEKSFHHAYKKGSIPVILGPPLEDCEALLPPNSFLHIDSFNSAKDLAAEMKRISKSDQEILLYHKWRYDFHVLNEHGYFGSKSYHFCRVCEALNFNDQEQKTYDLESLRYMLDADVNCQ